MTLKFRRPGAPHELNYEFTSQTWFAAHASSRLFSDGEERHERAAELEPRCVLSSPSIRVITLVKICGGPTRQQTAAPCEYTINSDHWDDKYIQT